jgi:hypothetical protein
MGSKLTSVGQNFHLQKSRTKVNIDHFFKQGVNHKETLIEGKPVNSEFCIQLLVGLLKQTFTVKPQF